MSELADQIEVMRLISQLKQGSFATHYFVPFDPFRKGPRALDLMKDAIRNKGAIGVKIYPPMGFKPSDSDQSSGMAHHLNDRMKALLDFCLKEDVPILAHCLIRSTSARRRAHAPLQRFGASIWISRVIRIFD
jgi:hypothetical protein